MVEIIRCRCGKKINRKHIIVSHPLKNGLYTLVCSDPCARKLIAEYAEENNVNMDYSVMKIYINRKKKELNIEKIMNLNKDMTDRQKCDEPITKDFVNNYKIKIGLDKEDKFLHELCDLPDLPNLEE